MLINMLSCQTRVISCLIIRHSNGNIIVRKHSSHGLGHIKNPFSTDSDWEKELWNDVLALHYGKKSIEEINDKYSDCYAVSEIAVTTPSLMLRFKKLNAGKSYMLKVKPRNFCLAGASNVEEVKPLAAYRKNAQEAVFDEFINYRNGEIMKGVQYWKDMKEIFWDYVNHPESKFEGDTGILQRKYLKVTNVVLIGKESNDLDESEVLGIDNDTYVLYKRNEIPSKKILALKPKEAEKLGIGKVQLYRMKKSILSGKPRFRKKTLDKLIKASVQDSPSVTY